LFEILVKVQINSGEMFGLYGPDIPVSVL